jgi:hypothetical protein
MRLSVFIPAGSILQNEGIRASHRKPGSFAQSRIRSLLYGYPLPGNPSQRPLEKLCRKLLTNRQRYFKTRSMRRSRLAVN